jgi:large subunit ribosomal protein L23
MDINDVIIRPIISERSMEGVSKGKFTFRVASKAHKGRIKKAIEDKFKVSVLQISTSIVKGRKVRAGPRRIEIAQSPWKKAVVTLKDGQKIALFDVGGGSTSLRP